MFDAVDAAWDRACALNFDALNPQRQLAVLRRCEKQRRRIPAVEHPLINSLARQAPSLELGDTSAHAITESMLISRAEAARRVKETADLGPRHGLPTAGPGAGRGRRTPGQAGGRPGCGDPQVLPPATGLGVDFAAAGVRRGTAKE